MTRRSVLAVSVASAALAIATVFVVRSALDTPERQVSAFLDATASANENAALDARPLGHRRRCDA